RCAAPQERRPPGHHSPSEKRLPCFSIAPVLPHRDLLADTEAAEDAVENVVGVDASGDLTKMFERLAQFDRNQLVAQFSSRRRLRLLQSIDGGSQALLAAGGRR